MKDHPIIFTGQNALLVRDGHKTQTRRTLKPQPKLVTFAKPSGWEKWWEWKGQKLCSNSAQTWLMNQCPYGSVGGRLWVREAWQIWQGFYDDYSGGWDSDEWRRKLPESLEELKRYHGYIEYRADGEDDGPWRSPLHLPRWASRTLLEVTGVRVESLQDITEDDAKAEGIKPFPRDSEGDCWTDGKYRTAFEYAWNEMHGWSPNSWETNPWVWVVEFKPVALATPLPQAT